MQKHLSTDIYLSQCFRKRKRYDWYFSHKEILMFNFHDDCKRCFLKNCRKQSYWTTKVVIIDIKFWAITHWIMGLSVTNMIMKIEWFFVIVFTVSNFRCHFLGNRIGLYHYHHYRACGPGNLRSKSFSLMGVFPKISYRCIIKILVRYETIIYLSRMSYFEQVYTSFSGNHFQLWF